MNIFLLPATNKNNTYIELTKKALAHDPDIRVIGLPHDRLWRILPFLFRAEVWGTKNIVHIHWPTVLYGSRFALKSLFLLGLHIKILALLKYVFGFKVVSTVHNCYAHDYPHPRIDACGTALVHRISNHLILQQQKTLSYFLKKYPHKKMSWIPHGNYIDVYGPRVSRDTAFRQSLGVADDDILLLSLGAIAPYKLNEKIIDTVARAQRVSPHLKLLVIGKGKEDYVATLTNRAQQHTGIIVKNSFVLDADIPRLCSVADYAVFYYDHSEMTSGGMILALSYGVPVIARDIPAAEIITEKNGVVFATDDEFEGILGHLGQTKSDCEGDASRDSIDSVRGHSWQFVGEKLASLYRSL